MAPPRAHTAAGASAARRGPRAPPPRPAARAALAAAALSAALALAAFLAPGGSLRGPFLLDDRASVRENPCVVGGAGAPQRPLSCIYENDFWGKDALASAASHKSWRPLTTLTYSGSGIKLLDWLISGSADGAAPRACVLLYTYRAQYALSGDEPLAFHCADRVLHAAASAAAAYAALVATCGDVLVAAACGALFAVHPIHAEAVSNTTGRAETLCALLLLVGFAQYARAAEEQAWRETEGNAERALPPRRPQLGQVAGVLFFTLLAMLAKEHGVVLPALCAAWELYRFVAPRADQGELAAWLRRAGPLLVGGALLALWRVARNGGTQPNLNVLQNPACFHEDALVRFLSYSWIYALNAVLLFVPTRLCADWSGPSIPLVDVGQRGAAAELPRLAGVAAFYAALTLTVAWSLAGSALPHARNAASAGRATAPPPAETAAQPVESPRMPLRLTLGFALAWAVLTFLLSSNLLTCVGFVIAERVLYLPSFGWCLAAGACLSHAARWLARRSAQLSERSALTLLALPLVLVFLRMCQLQDATWVSATALWGHAYAVNPRGVLPAGEYGMALVSTGEYSAAEPVLRWAMANAPRDHERGIAYYTLGVCLYSMGRCTEATEVMHEGTEHAYLRLTKLQEELNAATARGDRNTVVQLEGAIGGRRIELAHLAMGLSQTALDLREKGLLALKAVKLAQNEFTLAYAHRIDAMVDQVLKLEIPPQLLIFRYADSGADPAGGPAATEIWFRNATRLTEPSVEQAYDEHTKQANTVLKNGATRLSARAGSGRLVLEAEGTPSARGARRDELR